jgi:hypothetical protein
MWLPDFIAGACAILACASALAAWRTRKHYEAENARLHGALTLAEARARAAERRAASLSAGGWDD